MILTNFNNYASYRVGKKRNISTGHFNYHTQVQGIVVSMIVKMASSNVVFFFAHPVLYIHLILKEYYNVE